MKNKLLFSSLLLASTLFTCYSAKADEQVQSKSPNQINEVVGLKTAKDGGHNFAFVTKDGLSDLDKSKIRDIDKDETVKGCSIYKMVYEKVDEKQSSKPETKPESKKDDTPKTNLEKAKKSLPSTGDTIIKAGWLVGAGLLTGAVFLIVKSKKGRTSLLILLATGGTLAYSINASAYTGNDIAPTQLILAGETIEPVEIEGYRYVGIIEYRDQCLSNVDELKEEPKVVEKITKHLIEGTTTELFPTEKETTKHKDGIVKVNGKKYEFTKTEDGDNETIHYYKEVVETPKDTPKEEPKAVEKITKHLIEGTTTELSLTEKGTTKHKEGIIEFNGRKYEFTKTVDNDNETVHYYKEVVETPKTEPKVVEKLTKHLIEGTTTEISPVEKGFVAHKDGTIEFNGKKYKYSGETKTDEKSGEQIHYYSEVKYGKIKVNIIKNAIFMGRIRENKNSSTGWILSEPDNSLFPTPFLSVVKRDNNRVIKTYELEEQEVGTEYDIVKYMDNAGYALPDKETIKDISDLVTEIEKANPGVTVNKTQFDIKPNVAKHFLSKSRVYNVDGYPVTGKMTEGEHIINVYIHEPTDNAAVTNQL